MRLALVLVAACLVGAGCASAPRCPPAAVVASAPPAVAKGPTLSLALTPRPGAEPALGVAIVATGSNLGDLVGMTPEAIQNLVVEDAQGAITTTPAEGGFHLARAAAAPLRVRYEVRASPNPRARTSEVVVADDRFRAIGESFVLVPKGLVDVATDLTVAIDGKAIAAPEAASSLGAGASRTAHAPAGALVRSAFVAGSLERAVFDGAIEHDEAAWLGYTAFDPRPASAEIASVRTALRERWKGDADERYTVLLVSSARPAGSWSLVRRASGLLVHLGPGEPWSGALRLGITQHMQARWIGGELRVGTSEADGLWLTEGVSRVLAGELLRELGLFSAQDSQDLVNGLLAAQALSPHRGKAKDEVVKLASKDATARAHLAALGGLHALRLATLLDAKGSSLHKLVASHLAAVRDRPGPLSDAAWRDAIAKQLGEPEAKAWDDALRGRDVALPDNALGTCFRATTANHATFVLGFDAAGTLESETRTVRDLDPKGPAAAAGLRATDILEDASYRDGNAEVPVKLSVTRDGKKLEIKYAPRGEAKRGALFVRSRPGGDDVCGSVLP